MDFCIIAARFHENNISGSNVAIPFIVFYQDTIRKAGLLPVGGRSGQGLRRRLMRQADNRTIEALPGIGFEQVVDSARLEGLYGILVISGSKYHPGYMVYALQHIKTVGAGHLDIQENEVRLHQIDHPDSLDAVVAFSCYEELRIRLEVLSDQYSSRLFIVNNQYRHPGHTASFLRKTYFGTFIRQYMLKVFKNGNTARREITLFIACLLVMSILYGTPRLFSEGFSVTFLKEISVDCLIMAIACFPVWWLHFRKFTHLTVKRRLALHVATGMCYYAVWVALYQVYNHASGLPLMDGRQMFQNSGPNLLFYIQVFSALHIDLFFREREALHHREHELKEAAHRAEINALKAQIQPHFLFNTLNSISASVPADQEHTRVLVARLADIFRYALHSTQQELIPLSQELHFIKTYLLLEKERFGNRLTFEIHSTADTDDALIPPMLLQPLVENAVRHGVEPSIEGGEIMVACFAEGGLVHIRIENTGHPYAGPADRMLSSEGVGLSNTAKRLEGLYGEKLRVSVNSRGGVAVALSFRAPGSV